jgi:hypothetical protein
MMTTSETSWLVRWLVIIVLSAATIGMFLISMRANYLYGRGIGQTPETKEAIALANVGADPRRFLGGISPRRELGAERYVESP